MGAMVNLQKLFLGLLSVAFLALLASSSLAQDVPATSEQAEVEKVDADHADAGHTDAGHTDAGHTDAGHADGDHGDEHVDLDPTHANMRDETYKVVDFRTDMAFFSAIVFLVLLATLTTVAWKPIMQGLEKRERGIASNIANAQKASEDAMAKLAEYESKLASANQEAQQILADARKDAEATGQRLIATAQEEAVRQRERAVAEIDSAKRVALNELAEKSTDVAMTLAQRVVGREVNASDHQNLIQEMLTQLPSKN
jgi:F-type H+-transporting ATPase subunit b